MKILAMPSICELGEKTIKDFGLMSATEPGRCFMNAFKLVNRYSNMKYVLCLVKYKNEPDVPHAIILVGDSYYDPTLEAQNKHNDSTYSVLHKLTLDDIKSLISNGLGREMLSAMVEGKIPWNLPIVDESGNIIFD